MRGVSFTEIHSNNYFYDFPYFLLLWRFSPLPVGFWDGVFWHAYLAFSRFFQNPQSQTTNLKF